MAGVFHTVLTAGLSQILDPAGGDVVGWIGVEAQVAVVSVAEAPFELGPVMAGGFGEPVPECVP
jgi:hypothetical protein